MIEVNISDITKYYGADLIFEHITFDVKTGERVGLIGPNGCGKTTILKILNGEEHVQNGMVSFRKGIQIGYLDQIPEFEDHITIIDILKSAFHDVFAIKKKMDECALNMAREEGELLDIALKEYSRLTHEYELLDGYHVETNISKVSSGLNITEEQYGQYFNLLSGGEKSRVMLGKILLENPSFLMLDEPSNHLDLTSIEWLEGYLKEYKGTVLIVSHDRYFLDNVCTRMVEISTYKAYIYHGNYSYYVLEKERRFLLEMKAYLSQEKQIKRMEEQIKRYRIWGVMRDSDKMFKRAKELERRLEKIERLDKPKYENDKIRLRNSGENRSGKRVLVAHQINKQFEDLIVLEDAMVELIYQDRLAILGNNGSGKTTLIKTLLEDVQKEEPQFKWGSKISIGYLPQEVVFEDDSVTVLDYFMNKHNVNQPTARSELAKALFIRDDVYKQIRYLSGGEKSKLTLCSLTYDQVNLMILDEPTNHLDIDSREVLEEMLLEFTGTILFISHDRYFIKKIATRIGEIENFKIDYYEGDYDYYRFQKQRLNNNPTIEKVVVKPQTVQVKSDQHQKELEKQLLKIEEEIEKVRQKMDQNGTDLTMLQELYQKIQDLEEEYEHLFEQLETVE